MSKLPRDKIVAVRLEEMKRHEALDIAIAFLSPCTLVDCEVARILLGIMRDKELRMITAFEEEKLDDFIKTHVPYV